MDGVPASHYPRWVRRLAGATAPDQNRSCKSTLERSRCEDQFRTHPEPHHLRGSLDSPQHVRGLAAALPGRLGSAAHDRGQTRRSAGHRRAPDDRRRAARFQERLLPPGRATLRASGPAVSERVSHGLSCVRQAAKGRRQERFAALLHHASVSLPRDSFYVLKRQAAAGVDGMTWKE